jgi:anti-sigma regulatory factor (Ser/Thr protein kinase)
VFFVIGSSFESELASGVGAPGVARRFISEWFAAVLADGTLATARLLVSELVTNAVTHGRGRVTLRAQLSELRLLVEVIDEGAGFEPEFRERDFERPGLGGWGLRIVDTESSRWGVRRDRSHVWFELEWPGPRPGIKRLDDLTVRPAAQPRSGPPPSTAGSATSPATSSTPGSTWSY